jgi:predicted type IV restriction endonuclease
MANISKKVSERFIKSISKFQSVLKIAKDKDLNESDTVSIINDILGEVFGYDKYLEVTSEFAIRNTYCDLAIKIDNEIQFLIEVKAIGIELKENHLRQVRDYGANHGTKWVILTNGVCWEIYKIRFERSVISDLVCSFNFLDINPRNIEDQEKLFLVCKEGLEKNVRDEFYERVQSFNRFIIGNIILGEVVVSTLRKELRRLSPGLKVEESQIEEILSNEVLKRDVIEGEEASKALARVRKFYGKVARKAKEASEEKENVFDPTPIEDVSFSDKLLQQGNNEHEHMETKMDPKTNV